MRNPNLNHTCSRSEERGRCSSDFEKSVGSEFRVFLLGFNKNWKVGIGVFPGREEVLVGSSVATPKPAMMATSKPANETTCGTKFFTPSLLAKQQTFSILD